MLYLLGTNRVRSLLPTCGALSLSNHVPIYIRIYASSPLFSLRISCFCCLSPVEVSWCEVFSVFSPSCCIDIVDEEDTATSQCVRLLPVSSFFSVVSFMVLLVSAVVVFFFGSFSMHPHSPAPFLSFQFDDQRVGTDTFCPLVRINGSPRERCCGFYALLLLSRSTFFVLSASDALIRWFGCRSFVRSFGCSLSSLFFQVSSACHIEICFCRFSKTTTKCVFIDLRASF